MKITTLISSVAVAGLVLGMPIASMAHEDGVSLNGKIEAQNHSDNNNDDHGGFLGLHGRFGFGGLGVKANLGASLSARLDKIIARYDANKDKYAEGYARLQSRLVKIEAKLDEKGYDTTTLKADMLVLDGKVAKFAADYKAYIDALRVAKVSADAGDDAAAKAQIKVAKGLLMTARTSGLAVRTYYHDVIRVEIHNLKTQ